MRQESPVTQIPRVPELGGGGDQSSSDTLTDLVSALVSDIRFHCRVRSELLSAELRLGNQLDATERQISGRIKGATRNRKTEPFVISPLVREAAKTVKPLLAPMLKMLEKQRKAKDKEIQKLAEQLPVWATWAKAVRGIGPLALGLLVGEAGDLSNYANPAKLWKRMGLAVIHGERQRRVAGNPALAIEHGYNPKRRALAFVIGDCLIKQNGDGPYRTLYLQRKAFELTRLPEAPKKRKKVVEEDGAVAEKKGGRLLWAHRRASRYMQKRFLVDLWSAWRGLPGVPCDPADRFDSAKPTTAAA